MYTYSPPVILLFVAAALAGMLAFYILPRRHVPGGLALGFIALGIAVWSFGYAFEIAASLLADKVFWGQVQYFGIATISFLWMLFALAYANARQRQPVWVRWLGLIPIVTIVFVLTNSWHRLIWAETFIKDVGGLSVLGVRYGWWFWVHFVSSYIFLMVGTLVILRALPRMQGLYRAQIIALVIALVSPWLGNILYFAGINPDPTPFAFLFSVIAVSWAIFGFRLTEIAPIARDLVVEGLREGLIVLDMDGRVADINAAAGRMIGVQANAAIGKDIADLLTPWPHLVERFRDVIDVTETITVGQGETARSYEVRISALYDRRGNPVGRVINLRDAGTAPAVSPVFTYQEPSTRPKQVDIPPAAAETAPGPARQGWWGLLVDFFTAQGAARLDVSRDTNPLWAQTIERAYTMVLRVAASLGTISVVTFLLPLGFFLAPNFLIIIIVAVAFMWVLALARNLPFSWRVWSVSVLLYALALAEMLNYGYSAESFAFFMAFIAISALIFNFRGGLWAMLVGLATVGLLGWLIGARIFMPFEASNPGALFPASERQAFSSFIAFSASSVSLVVAINALMRSLSNAWQTERQASTLLQQERDLLEQRVAERTRDLALARDEALKTSAELKKYFLAIEQSGNTIVITDKNGNIQYANPSFEKATGYTRAEALGQNPRILKSGSQTSDFYRHMWEVISSGNVWRGELHNKRKNGTLFWESATIAPVQNEDGEITNYVAVKEDVTTQRELQDRIKQQKDYLAILHQITLDLLDYQDLDELLYVIVERACVLLDAPHGEIMLVEGDALVVHAFTKNQTFVLGERLDRGTAKFSWQAYDTGKPAIVDDYSSHPEHRDIYDSLNLHAVADFPVMNGTECIGVLALGRSRPNYPFTPDQIETGVLFSRMVALVLENARLYDSALKEIEQRKLAEEQLAIARDQALDASRFKTQLVAKVSHELRTPLGGIIGYAGLMEQGAFGELNDEMRDAVSNLMDSANYLHTMINELLDQAQIESGMVKLHIAPFAPQDLINRIQSTMTVLAQKKSLALDVSLAPNVPPNLLGDLSRLQQILVNLTGNAIKFTMSGAVRVDILRPDEHHWAMRVSDTGAGIPPEAQEFIFEPFRQVDNSITRNNRGTGLGLSSTKQLVDLMGGQIELQSEVGKGSTFTITLPLTSTKEETP